MNNYTLTIVMFLCLISYITFKVTEKNFPRVAIWTAVTYVISFVVTGGLMIVMITNDWFSNPETISRQRYMLCCAYYEGAPEDYLAEVEKEINNFNKLVESHNYMNNSNWFCGFGDWSYYGIEPIDVKELVSNVD